MSENLLFCQSEIHVFGFICKEYHKLSLNEEHYMTAVKEYGIILGQL